VNAERSNKENPAQPKSSANRSSVSKGETLSNVVQTKQKRKEINKT
jgi:hypothetical protein